MYVIAQSATATLWLPTFFSLPLWIFTLLPGGGTAYFEIHWCTVSLNRAITPWLSPNIFDDANSCSIIIPSNNWIRWRILSCCCNRDHTTLGCFFNFQEVGGSFLVKLNQYPLAFHLSFWSDSLSVSLDAKSYNSLSLFLSNCNFYISLNTFGGYPMLFTWIRQILYFPNISWVKFNASHYVDETADWIRVFCGVNRVTVIIEVYLCSHCVVFDL